MERFLLLTFLFASAYARMSVMYAHERQSDMAAERCFNEMYPKKKHYMFQASDEPCIIFCVLKKIGIMTPSGAINLDVYRRRMLTVHQLDMNTNSISDKGGPCSETAESKTHRHDVCKRAKIFNDCTHLYRMVFEQ